MEKKKKVAFYFLLVGVLTLALGFATPVEAKKEKKEIIIGAAIPLTGGGATMGKEMEFAYQAVVDDWNKAGGVFVKEYGKKLPVRIVFYDTETASGKSSAGVERLIKVDKADFLLGGLGSALGVIPGAITAEKYKKLYHASMCTFNSWEKHHFKYSTLMFYSLFEAAAGHYEIWNSLPEAKRPKRPALIVEDTFDGRSVAVPVRENAESHGYKFVLDTSFPVGGKDYSPQIIKAKSMGVDALVMHGPTADLVTFTRQMKENDFSVPYHFSYRAFLSGALPKLLGKDHNYLLSAGHWFGSYPYPGCKELDERFYKKFKKHSVIIGPLYTLGQTLFQAIQLAGTLDSLKVRQALIDNEFDGTVMGKIDYNEIGKAKYVCAIFQWWEGLGNPVWPFDVAAFKVKLAPAWGAR